jgi:hypothetical protein
MTAPAANLQQKLSFWLKYPSDVARPVLLMSLVPAPLSAEGS